MKRIFAVTLLLTTTGAATLANAATAEVVANLRAQVKKVNADKRALTTAIRQQERDAINGQRDYRQLRKVLSTKRLVTADRNNYAARMADGKVEFLPNSGGFDYTVKSPSALLHSPKEARAIMKEAAANGLSVAQRTPTPEEFGVLPYAGVGANPNHMGGYAVPSLHTGIMELLKK